METIVPARFLFRYAFPVSSVDGIPQKGKRLLNLSAAARFPFLGELENQEPIAELRLAWNNDGFAVQVDVTRPAEAEFQCDLKSPVTSNGLQIWIDTRNTQSIHRASRFCHHFCVLPAGGGKDGTEPIITQQPIARAKEETPLVEDAASLPVKLTNTKIGYTLEAWFPAEALNGYDPESSSKIGFYYHLKDHQAGEQHLTVNENFPFTYDPSLWSTLELLS